MTNKRMDEQTFIHDMSVGLYFSDFLYFTCLNLRNNIASINNYIYSKYIHFLAILMV